MAVNKRVKLQIERKGFIDLYEDINIPITKNLADIRDLSKRSGGYSTSIEVPGSKNNLQLFGHLYDINITNSTFSLKKKYKCVVIKDDIQIFQGYIRMEGINQYEGPDGKSIITFNVSLHDDVANFFMKIKDKYINPTENIDTTNNIFWDDLVIPKYNYSGITATFENTVEDKWKFFLPYQNRGYYQTTDFKPAVFAYEYVDRIISSAGYTWNGGKTVTTIYDKTFVGTAIFDSPTNTISCSDFNNLDIKPNDKVIISNTTSNGLYTVSSASGNTISLVSPPRVGTSTPTNPHFTIFGERIVDTENWNLLNYYTNFDKLVIPYAGNSDVIKDLNNYKVYAGIDNQKLNISGSTLIIGNTVSNGIALVLTSYPNILSVGDLVNFSATSLSAITVEFYCEVKQIVSTGTTCNYYVNVCDKYGIPFENQVLDSIYANTNSFIKVFDLSKYYLLPEPYTTLVPIFYSNEIFQEYKNETTPYFDRYNQLSSTTKDRKATTINVTNNVTTITIAENNITNSIKVNNSQYVAKQNGELTINAEQLYNLYISNLSVPSYLHNDIANTPVNFVATITPIKNGTEMTDFKTNIILNSLIATTSSSDTNSYFINTGTTKIFDNGLLQLTTKLKVIKGDVIDIKINTRMEYYNESLDRYCFWFESPICVSTFCANPLIYHIYKPISGSITYSIIGNVQEDDENISLTNFIPKKIKQSDLLLGLCRIFNLFIDYDEQKKSLLILPRDQYYLLGKKIDWSNKLDVSNKNNFLFYPDLKYKNYIYTYKLDNDDYSKAYNDNVKEIYGQVNVKFENDLLDGTTTIDSIFYSTPIARAGGNLNIYNGDCSNPTNINGGIVIPKQDGNLISIIDYTKTTNLKLLYDCGLQSDAKSTPFLFRIKSAKPLPTEYTYAYTCTIPKDDTTSSPAYNVGWVKYINKDNRGYYQYPHIGHFFNGPMQPNDDLNYAQCDYYFYNDINIFTENNLFYKHFLRTIRQQRDCRLLKAKLHLSPAEVNAIRFNNQYYLFDTWWVLNKFEYNEDGSDLYNIELINVI